MFIVVLWEIIVSLAAEHIEDLWWFTANELHFW